MRASLIKPRSEPVSARTVLLQHTRVCGVLNCFIPLLDIGYFVYNQVVDGIRMRIAQLSLHQPEEAMMVIDKFAGKKTDRVRRDSPRQQFIHPLFQQGRFADLPPSAQSVNTRRCNN